MVRRLVSWTGNVGCGRKERNKRQFKAEFVEGGTIGPVRC
jgi:hypothetical protein